MSPRYFNRVVLVGLMILYLVQAGQALAHGDHHLMLLRLYVSFLLGWVLYLLERLARAEEYKEDAMKWRRFMSLSLDRIRR